MANTEFKVKATPQGFPQAASAVRGLGDSAKKALEDQTKGLEKSTSSAKKTSREIQSLNKTIGELAKVQTAAMRAMQGLDRASKEYKQLDNVVKSYGRAMSEASKQVSNLARNEKRLIDQRRSAGSFTQGLIQGAVPEAGVIQRGPGALRQAAGGILGRGARNIAGGLAGSPLSGGMSIAGSIPLVGGFIQAGLQNAQLAIQESQLQTSLAPFRDPNAARRIRRAGRRARRGFDASSVEESAFQRLGGAQEAAPIDPNALAREREFVRDARVQQAINNRGLRDSVNAGGIGGRAAQRIAEASVANTADITESIARELAGGDAQRTANRETQRRRSAARAEAEAATGQAAGRARARARRQEFGNVAGVGVSLGLNQLEAQQAVGQIAAAGGGTTSDVNAQGLVGTGLRAQRLLGADSGTIGSFLRAGRRGGLTGAAGGEGLEVAIGQAVTLGLEGSEITEFLRITAQGIDQFRNTGVPFNQQSIGALTAGFKGAVGVDLARNLAQGLTGAGQRLATQGPQNAFDLLTLQAFGFQGGGDRELGTALDRAETGDFDTQGLQNVLGLFGNREDPRGLQRFLQRATGQTFGRGATRQLQQLIQSGDLEGAVNQFLELDAGARGRQALNERGGNIGRLDQQEAATQNRRLAAGRRLAPSALNFEEAGARLTGSVARLIDGPLTKISEGAVDIAEKVPKVIEGIENLIASLSAKGLI